LNCIGALANGKSYISFPKKTNATTMVIFLLELLRENTQDIDLKKEIDYILSHDKINPDFVENEMKMELLYKDGGFTEKIDSINQLNIPCEDKKGRLEKLLRTYTVSNNKLLYRLRSNQMEIIVNSSLYNKFNDIAIVWDNAPPHIANHVKDILNFLGVKLTALPVRCPDYNPIEYTWLDDKHETAKEPIDDENKLKKFFQELFYKLAEMNNYAGYWFKLIREKRKEYFGELIHPII
jgi:hypothetical protein